MNFARLHGRTSRTLLSFALCVAGAATIAARPAAPGMTYRVRVIVTPPDMPGMQMEPMAIVGKGWSLGSQSRLDIDTVTGQMASQMSVGDYMLMLDSGKIVMVSPSTKSYSEGMPGMGALPPDLLAQASFTNVNVTTEKLGAGEAMYGYPTQKYRVTTTYVLSIMGQSLNTMTTADMWVAQLPNSVSTAFDGAIPKSMSEGPMKELYDKTMESRKSLGNGTALKTVTSSQISGPMQVTTSTTTEIVDLKTADVDPAVFKLPEGYTKKP
jgi:hypothetical protein